jgi:hypothetical protein
MASIRVEGRGVGVGDEALAAAGFVFIGGADLDEGFGFDGALGVVGGGAAFDADRVSLGDEFGDREKLGHRFTRV